MSDEEKTHEPTEKKISDSRKKGNVPKSQEINGIVVLFVGTFSIFAMIGYMMGHIEELFLHFFQFTEILGKDDLTTSKTVEIFSNTGNLYFMIVGPLFLIVWIFAILSNVMQFGFLSNPLKVDFSKLNPINGLKNIFSLKKVVEMFKMLLKILFGIFLFVVLVSLYKDNLVYIGKTDLSGVFSFYRDFSYIMFSVILFVIFVFAVVDLFFVRHNYFEKLKMSEKEIRDEYKQMEGDPMVKQRIREVQRRMASNTMMMDVKTADMVITNPTHYAVALRYDQELENSPRVVAKGSDHIALQIKLIARENNIPIMENVSLARALHAGLEVDEEIGVEFYQAVADLFVAISQIK